MVSDDWKSDKWWVSRFNYADEVRRSLAIPDRLVFHDVTLRDGEQQTGIVFRKDEKIKIANELDEVGIDRIEAGMPAVSEEDKEAIKSIASSGLDAETLSFARAMKSDVDLALECEVDGVVCETPAAEHIIKYGYGWPVEKAIDNIQEATSYGREHGLHVTSFLVDSTRSDLKFLKRIIEAACEAGADAICLADTFGVLTPHSTAYLVGKVKNWINVPIEIHCHNDFGMATANTIAAVCSGASVVHVTVNRLGERCGNAAFEEVALALKTMYGVDLDLKYEKFRKLSKMVEKYSQFTVPTNKPIVGDRIFSMETGLIVHIWKKLLKQDRPLELFPFRWDLVGFEGVDIPLGKKSGKTSVEMKLDEKGITASTDQIIEILESVKIKGTKKKDILSEEEFDKILQRIGLI